MSEGTRFEDNQGKALIGGQLLWPEEILRWPFATLPSQTETEAILKCFCAFWRHEGEPRKEQPHARLKGEAHSNGFIAAMEVLKYPRLCEVFARVMLEKIRETTVFPPLVDVVVGSAYSAINLSWEVARLISQEANPAVEHRIAEKDSDGNPTIIRGGIDQEKRVLIVNELMTTGGGSTWETRKAVLDCNGADWSPKVLEPAFVLFHRSRDYALKDGSLVVPVFHFDIENFHPGREHCPFCAAGSEALKPKVGDNWKKHFSRD